jgi:hypothetical protein
MLCHSLTPSLQAQRNTTLISSRLGIACKSWRHDPPDISSQFFDPSFFSVELSPPPLHYTTTGVAPRRIPSITYLRVVTATL